MSNHAKTCFPYDNSPCCQFCCRSCVSQEGGFCGAAKCPSELRWNFMWFDLERLIESA